ncbi:hypothetical protein [Desulfovibrio sp. Huiquan2017]|uniref:hypothetical protein n=1 Tax=Desulfovibrio sp. Huiquan2017 TaxID=2816861 RepID=UPI001A939567|nr:hypothetical protein [Desulfovibrio sp. Huiquan2017]
MRTVIKNIISFFTVREPEAEPQVAALPPRREDRYFARVGATLSAKAAAASSAPEFEVDGQMILHGLVSPNDLKER